MEDFVIEEEPTIEATFQMDATHDDHNLLVNRDLPNQHPMGSITGLEMALDNRVDKTSTASQVYGTDSEGNQTTYDVGSFGQVDDVQVGGVSVVENKIANLGTMAGETASDYSTKAVADTLYADISYEGTIDNHIADKNNPHEVTKTQVGLGNVDNTSDLDKPVSTATQNALNLKVNTTDLGNAELDIQKNGTSVGKFTANASTDKVINLVIPTQASDVNALPDSTKYGASLSLTINSSTYVVTAQLKDQDGNNLGSAQTIDLPLESVVVNGSYDSTNKKIVLTLENGNTIDIPVGDLVAGLQSEITSNNKLSADLVDDTNTTNKFVTSSDINTWNAKQNALTAGTGIDITSDTISNSGVRSISTGATNGTISVNTNGTNAEVAVYGLGSAAYTASTDYATSAQGTKADTAVQPNDNITTLTNNAGYITGITSSDVTTALGYTPYSSANPDGYTSNVGTVTSVNNNLPDANGNVTISTGGTYTAGTGIDITSNVISVDGVATNELTVDTVVTQGSNGLITSGAVYSAISASGSDGYALCFGENIYHLFDDKDSNGLIPFFVQNTTELVIDKVKNIPPYGCSSLFNSCTALTSVSFPNLLSINGDGGCSSMFFSCTALTSVSFPNLLSINGASGCFSLFNSCTALTSVSFPNLLSINGASGCSSMFNGCTALTSVSFSELTTIHADYAFISMLSGCTKLQTASFPKLNNITPSAATVAVCSNMFNSCRELTDVYFNALTTTSFGSSVLQFNNMFNSNSMSTSGNCTMHFPSNLSTTISGLTGYPNFGATVGRLTLAFDLPATS